ncbi:MAG: hypothetical protein KC481_05190 [Acidimicrobiaceae bacterium]|nr:hypothetical protein [Acidimicrobiaceae bacterium]MCO4833033.1 hypothetical protein [Acidimicrobiaceae bacterium]MDC1390416.1 hypothetical protein [Acidimicrobiales bacterium]MDG1087021.1 hypothetical protein [Acidimicrobiales bacterium]
MEQLHRSTGHGLADIDRISGRDRFAGVAAVDIEAATESTDRQPGLASE